MRLPRRGADQRAVKDPAGIERRSTSPVLPGIEFELIRITLAMARVDFFLRPDMSVVVNEVNTIPGFTNVSMYPLAFKARRRCGIAVLDRMHGDSSQLIEWLI